MAKPPFRWVALRSVSFVLAVSACDASACVHEQTDNAHCGGCAVTGGAGTSCAGGTCSPNAPRTATYVPLAQPTGTPPASDWTVGQVEFAGATQIIRDMLGKDLIGFVHAGSNAMTAFVSQDDGGTWSWVNTGFTAPLWPSGITQDPQGKIHIVACQSFATAWSYTRVAMTRNAAGHITGFTKDSQFSLSTPDFSGSNHGHIIAGTDLSNNPVLFFAVYDGAGVIHIGKSVAAAGYHPQSVADFVGLAGGAITSITTPASCCNGSHNSDVQMAQHPASHDLWLQWGAMDTGDNNSNPMPLVRSRFTAQQSAGMTSWATSAALTTTVYQGGIPNAQALAMVSTPNYVWFLRGGGVGGTAASGVTGGMVVDRADRNGAVTYAALPSVASAQALGWFGLSIDPVSENRAYVVGWVSVDAAVNPNTFLVKFWNGASWLDLSSHETKALGDPWGLGMSSGWGAGQSVLFVGDSLVPYVATLRGG